MSELCTSSLVSKVRLALICRARGFGGSLPTQGVTQWGTAAACPHPNAVPARPAGPSRGGRWPGGSRGARRSQPSRSPLRRTRPASRARSRPTSTTSRRVTTPAVLTFLPSTITATIAYASTGNGGDNTPGGTGQVAATDTSPPWNYIEVEMLDQLSVGDTVDGDHHAVAQAVTNLSFRIHDIDKTVRVGWDDLVIVNTAGLHLTERARTSIGLPAPPADAVPQPAPGDQDDRLRPQTTSTSRGPVRSARSTFSYRAGDDRQLRQPAHRHRQHQLQRLRRQPERPGLRAPSRRSGSSSPEARALVAAAPTRAPQLGRRPDPTTSPVQRVGPTRARLDSRAAARASRLLRLPRRGHPVRAGSAVIDWAGPSCRPSARSASVAGVP